MRTQQKQNRIFRKQLKELKSGSSGARILLPLAPVINPNDRGKILIVDDQGGGFIGLEKGQGFIAGDRLTFVNISNSDQQIVTPGFGDGVDFRSVQGQSNTVAVNGTVEAVFIGNNTWMLSGDLTETPAGP